MLNSGGLDVAQIRLEGSLGWPAAAVMRSPLGCHGKSSCCSRLYSMPHNPFSHHALQPVLVAIGAGVLSLPFAFRAAGWAGGLLLTAAVAAVEGFTMYVIARYAEWTGSKTYSDLVRKLLGRKAALSMSLGLLFYTYGAGVQGFLCVCSCLHLDVCTQCSCPLQQLDCCANGMACLHDGLLPCLQ
jgi:hypothetical protein